MTSLVAIAAGPATPRRRLGLHRALVTRRANLGDCADAGDVLRRLVSPAYLRRPACVIPIRRRWESAEPTASDLALAAARRALSHPDAPPPEAIGAIVYCHVVPDEHTSESTVGRLQWELGLKDANPIAISQAHHGALLVGLHLAAALVEGPEQAGTVLLVASDKLLQETPARRPRGLLFGDGAGAAVVCPGEDRPGWRIDDVRTRHFPLGARAQDAWDAATTARFVDGAATTLRELFQDHGVTSSRLAAVMTSVPDEALVTGLHRLAGLPAPSAPVPAAAAVPDLLALLGAPGAVVARGARALAWTGGPTGEFTCALLTRN